MGMGANRDWNIDLVPKFVMAEGDLVKILQKTRVSRYLEWMSCDRSYVYQPTDAGLFSAAKLIHSVPTTATEGLKSGLMGIMENQRFINCQFHWSMGRCSTIDTPGNRSFTAHYGASICEVWPAA